MVNSQEAQILVLDSNHVFFLFLFPDAKRLIGRKFSDPVVQDDISLWPFKVTAGDNDRPMITVRYKDQEKQLFAEEVSSMLWYSQRCEKSPRHI
jgi:molecular chaperone DnaK (HSP70)